MTENDNDATVTINGRIMSGYVAHEESCNTCSEPSVFSLGHWAHFCPVCNYWMTTHCGDATCMFCVYRKTVPLA
jgi:hypothetical protein